MLPLPLHQRRRVRLGVAKLLLEGCLRRRVLPLDLALDIAAVAGLRGDGSIARKRHWLCCRHGSRRFCLRPFLAFPLAREGVPRVEVPRLMLPLPLHQRRRVRLGVAKLLLEGCLRRRILSFYFILGVRTLDFLGFLVQCL